MEILSFEEFAPLFGPWADLFRPFIESKAMFDIYARLKSDAQKEIIVPKSENVFRTFATSHPDNVKSIWYLMDPYPKRYKTRVPHATGIAMDCSNSPDGKMQPSLEKFYDGLSKDIGKEVERSLSLEYLNNQGVMMLNTDLTCKLAKTGSHDKVWEPFQKFFLEEIMGQKTGIIYVLAGKNSHRMEKFITPIGNYILKVDHPVTASYKNTDWDTKNVFSLTNKILKENKGKTIFWDKKEWDYENEPPF